MTKDWKYISVRYDIKNKIRINKGLTFKGWKGSELQYPYYTRNGHLGNIRIKKQRFLF